MDILKVIFPRGRGGGIIFHISDFHISGHFLIKVNCHNHRTGNDTEMKLGPVTKFNKKNKTTSKNFDDDVMPKN